MYYLRILLFNLFTSSVILSQNLVLNPSFEENTIRKYSCPTVLDLVGVTYWEQPTWGSTDYFKKGRKCLEVGPKLIEGPRSGEYCMGVLTLLGSKIRGYKEYIQGQFTNPLEVGKEYLIEFYICLDHTSRVGTSGIGAYIGKDFIFKKTTRRLKYTPQVKCDSAIIDRFNWTKVSGTYIAKGGEKYITIGSFDKFKNVSRKPTSDDYGMSSKVCYYYLDDVSVIEVTPEFKSITREETIKIDTITISKLPNVGNKIIMSSLRFRTNQHNLIDSTHKELDKIVTLLTVNPFLKVEISGHTDSIGNPKTNIILSERRAETVKQILLEKGISINRISTSGKGSSEPISTNSTEEGRAMNRRIEITITDVFEYKE